MVRALATVLLLGMFPHASVKNVTYSVPAIDLVSIPAPTNVIETYQAPLLSASGAMLIDLESGQKIFAKAENIRRPMGSLAKMMTALLIIENHSMDEIIRVPTVGALQNGSSIGLTEGQRFRLGDLMYALLISSANDAAYTLAMFHSGTINGFVDAMNERAKTLGMLDTQFANPAGFDNDDQYSTPRDLTWLSVALLNKPKLKEIVNRRYARIFSRDGIRFDLTNTNELLHSNDNVFGIKTGTTDEAGQCLVTYFTYEDRSYLLVLLGSEARYVDALAMLQAFRFDQNVL